MAAAGSTNVVDGMTIPTTHPRLWFNAARLAQAQTWYQAKPFTARSDDYQNLALMGLLTNNSKDCEAAVAGATTASQGMDTSGVACDYCRWNGEIIILTYDWCYNLMTAAQRSTLQTSLNTWIDHWRTQSWGGPGMYENNYYWGYLRNELEWAITSFEDNTAEANTLLTDVFATRLADDFNPATAGTGHAVGGVGQEGSEYGPYVIYYAAVPFITARLLGHDVLTDTSYWESAVYAMIYQTVPGLSFNEIANSSGYEVTPWSDTEGWFFGGSAQDPSIGDFMSAAANHWSTVNTGAYARQWLNMTGAPVDYHILSTDSGGPAARAFTNLPLDYYASGPQYLWGHSAWTAPANTTFFLQLGVTWANGHSHEDYGTWQMWRNGRWLSHETAEYSVSITGYGGSGAVGIDDSIAHNALYIGGAGSSADGTNGTLVTRLESQPTYVYADADESNVYGGTASHVEREFVFVRGLETMVIFDRIQSSSASAEKTFLAHCAYVWTVEDAQHANCTDGTQVLRLTSLLSSPTLRVIQEHTSGNTDPDVGQSRLEVVTAPATAQSYILTVLQATDGGAASLAPSVVDNGSSYIVTLNGQNSITFAKGMASSGGSITTSSGTTSFRADVQPMVVTDDGPVWQ